MLQDEKCHRAGVSTGPWEQQVWTPLKSPIFQAGIAHRGGAGTSRRKDAQERAHKQPGGDVTGKGSWAGGSQEETCMRPAGAEGKK